MGHGKFTVMAGPVAVCAFSSWELALGYALRHPNIDRIVESRPAEVRVWPLG